MGSETTRTPARLRRLLAYLWRRLQATEKGADLVRLILRVQGELASRQVPPPG